MRGAEFSAPFFLFTAIVDSFVLIPRADKEKSKRPSGVFVDSEFILKAIVRWNWISLIFFKKYIKVIHTDRIACINYTNDFMELK